MAKDNDAPLTHSAKTKAPAAILGFVVSPGLFTAIVGINWWVSYQRFPSLSIMPLTLVVFGASGAIGGTLAAAIMEKLFGSRKWVTIVGGVLGGIVVALAGLWALYPALLSRSE